MGNLLNQIPIASSCITIANLALCGFPFIAGFYSKDLILESAINSYSNSFILILALLSLGLTSFYSIRFILTVIWGPQSRASFINITEHNLITTPIIILSSISICTGRIIRWLPPLNQYIFIIPQYIKLMPISLVLVGAVLAWSISSATNNNISLILSNQIIHYASCIIWFLVPISSQFIIKSPIWVSHNYLKYIDQGWFETPSGNGLHNYLVNSNNILLNIIPSSPSSYLISSSAATAILIIFFYIYIYC
jgi:NADH-ubiquinone oxidoreductase chain 5